MKRRDAILAGGAAAGALALGWRFRPAPTLEFEEAKRPKGYRRLAGEGASLGAGVLSVGLDREAAALEGPALCEAAFGGAPQGAGQLAIAVFSDFYCPYCRVLDAELRDIVQNDARAVLIHHEVPLLGQASVLAARGALAAKRQGAYAPFYDRLIATRFIPTERFLADIAASEGLDTEQFRTDLNSLDITQELAQSLAAFRGFGFAGTPGVAVGRTLINGVISPRALRALVALEIAEGPPPGCLA